jgi:hypothetical protein
LSRFNVTKRLRLTLTGSTAVSGDVDFVSGSVANAFTLSGSTSGTTGSPTTFTVTPNGTLGSTVVVTPAATNAGSVSPSTLSFASGLSNSQTFTVTRAADGVSSVSITNDGGLSNFGTPITHTSTSSALTTIGPATPEQIALFLPVADTVPYTATATCRYKRTVDSTWTTGHPLYRIREDFSNAPFYDELGSGELRKGFAWPIIDLSPGTSYDVEVTLSNGSSVTTHTLTTTTRSLPAASGTANKTASTLQQILDALPLLVPGDVLEIADGTYTLPGGASALLLTASGTLAQPIVIRGQSRTGTILWRNASDAIITPRSISHVILERMTLRGPSSDGGSGAGSKAINGFNEDYSQDYLTVRNIIAEGVDCFVYLAKGGQGHLIYNNTATGNNTWTAPYLDTSLGWSDDGIHLPGSGNCAWQNTMSGFGDTFAYCSGFNQGARTANAVHFYRNDIRNSVDDAVEVDDAEACCTWYDNRVHNGINADSMDPLCGGPFLSARNYYVNLYRTRPHKWNSQNSGYFFYNNTYITPQSGSTSPSDTPAFWYQPSTGAGYSFGYRNNAHVYTGDATKTLRLESSGFTPMDWSYNSWYPDREFDFGALGSGANLAAAQSGLPSVVPVFSGLTQWMQQDSISSATPWTTTVTLPATSASEVTATYLPTPATGSALKNTGVSIPNITDGFTGSAPDRGAKIEGRAEVDYGDQTEVIPSWVPSTAWQWTQISGTQWDAVMSVAGGAPSQTGDPESSDYNTQWDFGGVAYSPKNHEMWLFGGGHNGTTINALSRWNLGTSSPSVSMMCAPTPVATRLADWNAGAATWEAAAFHTAGGGAEARPKSPHAYLNNRYFDDIDEFISLGLAAVDNPSGAVTRYFACPSFPRSGSAWRTQGYFPDIENAGTYGPQNACVFESYDRAAVYYAGYNSPLYKITSAGVKSTIGSSLGDVYRAHGCAQSLTQALTVGGTDASNPQGYRAKFINLTTGVATTVTVSGYAWPANFQYFGLVWSSTLGKYIALLLDEGTGNPISIDDLRIVTLEPTGASTMTAANVTLTGTAPTHFKLSTAMHIDEAYGVLLFAMTPTQPLYAIKVS